ncbi:hypothetical protein [Serratia marcescens]|uniref:hypothetical protein n=1 Tax=Serratia TaxID=613 RepID=UPI003BA388E0
MLHTRVCFSMISCAITIFFTSLPAAAYTGWTSPHKTTKSQVSWSWTISDNPSTPGVVDCNGNSPYCAFGPYVRTGLGPSGSMCDSGGVCSVFAERYNGITSVKVPRGTSYDEAFEAYVKRWGWSGTSYASLSASDPNIAWGKLCTGFATLPWGQTSVSKLIPGASCAMVTPPDINCETSIPAEIDLGTVAVGYIEAETTVDGITQCSADNTVSVSLAVPPSLGGVPVELFINGKQLSTAVTAVGKGMSIPLKLRASLRGTIWEAGEYTSNAVLNISYL